MPSRRLFNPQQLNVEGEGGIRWNNSWMATASVGVVRRAHQLGTLSDRHLSDALVPAADDLALADGEPERLAAGAGRIEHGSVVQRAGVVHDGNLALLRVGRFVSGGKRLNLYAHFSSVWPS